METAMVYCGTRIRDREEMLCLTDMWRAAGADESKRPSDWLAQPVASEFVSHIADGLNASISGIIISERGRGGATWAHWQIGLAYAKYLSPEFHAWCNEVVRSHMELTRKEPSSLALLDSLFDRKLAPVHRGIADLRHEQTEMRGEIAEVRGNVVFLTKRVDDMAPRNDFTTNTRRMWICVEWKFYNGLCPCCRKVKIVSDRIEIKGAAHADHFNGHERNTPQDGWLVCVGCNYKLANDAQYKERAKPHFLVFQDNLLQMFGTAAKQSSRKRNHSKTVRSKEQPDFGF